ncbi:MAG: zinc ABC transporter substrate-binding protein, partial [Anaerolineae bacterium]|nr:zinc ABC transporter substrate-binding protein [Anaerolineae bacterium]
MMRTAVMALLLILLVGVPLHAQAECAEPAINVLATVGMIADVAQNIGGDCVHVRALMGPGVDPHLYAATERDVEYLFDADIIFYGGLHLEARMIDVFEQVHTGLNKPVVAVSERIPEDRRLLEAGTQVSDPHVWMDVSLWMYAAEAIRDALTEQYPEHAAYFMANADAYLAQMRDLDQYIREQIERIPAEQRVLVTAHDAFQYYSRAYGIEVFAPQGISTQAEAGVQNIRETVQLLVDRQIPAIFVETSVSPRVIEAIIAGAQAQGHEVEIGGSLFSDAMGD